MIPKTSYIIIALLVVFNLFMLYQNVQRENRVSILYNQLAACEQITDNPSMHTATVTLPSDLKMSEHTLSLITFFTDRGCAPCVIDEIDFINDLYRQYDRYMKMYLVEGHERYLDNLGARFRYAIVNDIPELGELYISNPVSLLIDRNGTVHHIHYAETGNVEKSRVFFKKVNSLFESVYGG